MVSSDSRMEFFNPEYHFHHAFIWSRSRLSIKLTTRRFGTSVSGYAPLDSLRLRSTVSRDRVQAGDTTAGHQTATGEAGGSRQAKSESV